ncbi:hypothetical protein OS242_08250 [Tumebacillus sp. DT12]|uniref:Spore coat protein n=1 Tax=Tumebacillus lacus TaxID=2995335 RepID=A0ABT3WZ65_9BACL|nr:hypothetical protein [Tumebacillus lacus]MCX7569954.1 hypothetical protein [Tumebacillus lacus]
MNQNKQLHHLEAELAVMQVELRQVRQMIGSLIRTEHETRRLYEQATAGKGPFPIPQFIQQENEALRQYEQMRSVSDRMYQNMDQFAQNVPGYGNTGNTVNYRNDMNPMNQDPMQTRF